MTERPDALSANMSPDTLREAVATAHRAVTEILRRCDAETVAPIAETGVDLISTGA